MAAARRSPRTVEPVRGWGFDDTDTWEPVVPDTWQVPVDTEEATAEPGPNQSAVWTDAARTDEEWADAADWDGAREGAARPGLAEAARVPYLEAVAAGYLG